MRFALYAVSLLFLVATVPACSSSSAQNAAVVEEPISGLQVLGLTQLNSTQMVFVGMTDAPPFTEEPWVTDGTPQGTFLLKNFSGGILRVASGNDAFAVLNGTAYFVADDGVNGLALWRTDGSVSGTTIEASLVLPPGGTIVGLGSIGFNAGKVFISTNFSTNNTDEFRLFVITVS